MQQVPIDLAAAIVDWQRQHEVRLRQVQGFAYGGDGLTLTVRDCWLNGGQVIWQHRSAEQTYLDDSAEMMRQIDIYCLQLALDAVLEPKADNGKPLKTMNIVNDASFAK